MGSMLHGKKLLPTKVIFGLLTVFLLSSLSFAHAFLSHSFWLPSNFPHPPQTGEQNEEADEKLFKEGAQVEGDPVTSISLNDRLFINNRFLVTIKKKYPKLKELRLLYVPITDSGLKHLTDLPDLRYISLFGLGDILDNTGISDQALENIKTLRKVEHLDFVYTRITYKGLASLKDWTELRDLHIGYSPISNEGLKIIQAFPKLEKLALVRTQVTEAGLAHLSNMKTLKKLRIPDVPTDRSLRSFRDLRNLEELSLDNAPVTGGGLVHLNRLEKLQKLSLIGTKISGTGLGELPKSIQELDLSKSWVTDSSLKQLANLPCLRVLEIRRTKITDMGLHHLVRIDSLESLSLYDCDGITDNGAPTISQLKNLKKLDLTGTKITDSGLAQLHKLNQLQELNFRSYHITKEGCQRLQKALPGLKIESVYQ